MSDQYEYGSAKRAIGKKIKGRTGYNTPGKKNRDKKGGEGEAASYII